MLLIKLKASAKCRRPFNYSVNKWIYFEGTCGNENDFFNEKSVTVFFLWVSELFYWKCQKFLWAIEGIFKNIRDIIKAKTNAIYQPNKMKFDDHKSTKQLNPSFLCFFRFPKGLQSIHLPGQIKQWWVTEIKPHEREHFFYF